MYICKMYTRMCGCVYCFASIYFGFMVCCCVYKINLSKAAFFSNNADLIDPWILSDVNNKWPKKLQLVFDGITSRNFNGKIMNFCFVQKFQSFFHSLCWFFVHNSIFILLSNLCLCMYIYLYLIVPNRCEKKVNWIIKKNF